MQYYNGNVFTWKQGRRLDTVTDDGIVIASYNYDENGIRTSKTTRWSSYKYILNGSQIAAETWDDCINIYLYDENGSPIGFLHRYANMAEDTYNTYFYEKNMFGDILAIYDQNGVKQVSYSYDAFGKSTQTIHVADTRAWVNHLRYRGYYYDKETGFYYLNSRYYDPEIGRFINADGYVSTGQGLIGYNMFAYCNNNPVMFSDPTGESFIIAIKALVAILAVVVTVSAANSIVTDIQDYLNTEDDITEEISNQRDVNMSFGLSDVSTNGCGPVATHNAILLADKESSFKDVNNYLSKTNLTFGCKGAYFWNMDSYLESKGFNSETHVLWDVNVDELIKNSPNQVGILAYKHSNGGHYVAIKYNGSEFVLYNGPGGETITTSSINIWLTDNGKKYLCLTTI